MHQQSAIATPHLLDILPVSLFNRYELTLEQLMGWIPDPKFTAEQAQDRRLRRQAALSRWLWISCLILAILIGMLLGAAGMAIRADHQRQQLTAQYQAQIAALTTQLQSRFLVMIVANEQANVQLAPNATCTQHSSASSGLGTLVFRNLSDRTVHITWLDFYGQEVPYYAVRPGTIVVQSTSAGHPWCVRDDQNNIVLSLQAAKGIQVIDIPH